MIPAIIIGLALSIPILFLISGILESGVGIPLGIFPSASGFIWSIVLGLFIPIVSALYPIKEALSQTLNE